MRRRTSIDRTLGASALATSLSLVAACTPERSQRGSLGRGEFTYGCLGADDAACQGVREDLPFPSQVSLGSRFLVGFTPDATTAVAGAITVVPVSRAVLATDGTAFETRLAGRAGVLAVGGDGVVVDTSSIVVATPTRVRLTDDAGDVLGASITLSGGQRASIHATAFGELGAPLAGDVVCDADVSDPKLATLDAPSQPSPVGLTAGAAGSGTLRLTCAGVPASVALEVR